MVWKHEKQTSSFAKMLVLLNGNLWLSIYVEYGNLFIVLNWIRTTTTTTTTTTTIINNNNNNNNNLSVFSVLWQLSPSSGTQTPFLSV
jgi:hypothetical protein